ncbi:7-dehydrocholesterol reductase, partial [Caligus rogercresseyi]
MDDHTKQNVIPAVFLGVFHPTHIHPGRPGKQRTKLLHLGSFFAWKLVIFFYAWAFLSIFLYGGKPFEGPPVVSNGYVPNTQPM